MKARSYIEHRFAFSNPLASFAGTASLMGTAFYSIFVMTTSRNRRALGARPTPHSGIAGPWLIMNPYYAPQIAIVGLPSTWAVISRKFVGADSPRPRPTGSQGLGVWGADEWSKLPQHRVNYSIYAVSPSNSSTLTERPRFRQPYSGIAMDKLRVGREGSWPWSLRVT